MFLKKLFLSLGTLGVVAGASSGVYYSFNKQNDKKISENANLEDTSNIRNENTKDQQVDSVDSDTDTRPDDNLEVSDQDRQKDLERTTAAAKAQASQQTKLTEDTSTLPAIPPKIPQSPSVSVNIEEGEA